MKHLFFIFLFSLLIIAPLDTYAAQHKKNNGSKENYLMFNKLDKKDKNNKLEKEPIKQNDNQEETVILESFDTMLNSFGQIVGSLSGPNNPAVIAPLVTSMFGAFVKVLVEIFRTTPLRNNKIIMEHMEAYFQNLSKEEYTQLVSIIVAKAYEIHKMQTEQPEKI